MLMPGATPLPATLSGALALQVVMLRMLWAKTYLPLPWHHEWDTLELLRSIAVEGTFQ